MHLCGQAQNVGLQGLALWIDWRVMAFRTTPHLQCQQVPKVLTPKLFYKKVFCTCLNKPQHFGIIAIIWGTNLRRLVWKLLELSSFFWTKRGKWKRWRVNWKYFKVEGLCAKILQCCLFSDIYIKNWAALLYLKVWIEKRSHLNTRLSICGDLINHFT